MSAFWANFQAVGHDHPFADADSDGDAYHFAAVQQILAGQIGIVLCGEDGNIMPLPGQRPAKSFYING